MKNVRPVRMLSRKVLLALLFVCATLGLAVATPQRPASPGVAPAPTEHTFASAGDAAMATLVEQLYDGNGLWHDCPAAMCRTHNHDWGSDSLTYTLYVRWSATHDAAVPPLLKKLSATARRYEPPCRGRPCLLWSDVPLWDAIAEVREYEVDPQNTLALIKAKAAFAAVEESDAYATGACPAIRYQRPNGRGDRLKTLETDSNGVKAALLLYDATGERRYLAIAQARYAAIRRYFLDPKLPLYSVYVFDDGRHCVQVPHRFFASVNGNMIWSGERLYRRTGNPEYREHALETARAVERHLSDSAGVFTDLQAENDLEEPLVEAMLDLATIERQSFARRWILTNATAALSARKPDGTYGRFFDGPPPSGIVTAWQTNGGLVTEIAAAALSPAGIVRSDGWEGARFVPYAINGLPATFHVAGSGIALIGTLGDVCCEAGHARILIDGVETTNGVGLWQNKSSAGRRFPNSVLFAWRWPTAGEHVVTLLPGLYNGKEGGPFLHLSGYVLR